MSAPRSDPGADDRTVMRSPPTLMLLTRKESRQVSVLLAKRSLLVYSTVSGVWNRQLPGPAAQRYAMSAQASQTMTERHLDSAVAGVTFA